MCCGSRAAVAWFVDGLVAATRPCRSRWVGRRDGDTAGGIGRSTPSWSSLDVERFRVETPDSWATPRCRSTRCSSALAGSCSSLVRIARSGARRSNVRRTTGDVRSSSAGRAVVFVEDPAVGAPAGLRAAPGSETQWGRFGEVAPAAPLVDSDQAGTSAVSHRVDGVVMASLVGATSRHTAGLTLG